MCHKEWSCVILDGNVVTPDFKDKIECIKYMCARIKLHTCTTIVNSKDSVKSNKESIKPFITRPIVSNKHSLKHTAETEDDSGDTPQAVD